MPSWKIRKPGTKQPEPATSVAPSGDLQQSRVDRAGQLLADSLRMRAEHARPLSSVAANLRYYDEEDAVVAQRLKKLPTIAGKLLREPRMKLSRMADIGGVRAVLPDQRAVYRIGARLRKNWTITKTRDYIAEPKDGGYRALHLINRHRGRLIEVQLRTVFQDAWANTVQANARVIAPGLKFGGGPEDVRAYFADLAEMVASLDQGRLPEIELLVRMGRLKKDVDTLKTERER